MLIAIDFDGTLTEDPALWREFVFQARERGHRFVCITARRNTDENTQLINDWMDENLIQMPLHFTNLASKVEYATKRGLNVDVWIDDDPERCAIGH